MSIFTCSTPSNLHLLFSPLSQFSLSSSSSSPHTLSISHLCYLSLGPLHRSTARGPDRLGARQKQVLFPGFDRLLDLGRLSSLSSLLAASLVLLVAYVPSSRPRRSQSPLTPDASLCSSSIVERDLRAIFDRFEVGRSRHDARSLVIPAIGGGQFTVMPVARDSVPGASLRARLGVVES